MTEDTAPLSGERFVIRKDLGRSEQRHQGATVLVVKDPVTRRYFRFTEAQAAIIALMDEPIDAESLAVSLTEKLGREVSPVSIRAFFNSLEQKFLVDTPLVREKLEAMAGQKRKEQNLLYWKLGSIDPERIFAWLIPRTKWAFTPTFHVFGIFAILCGFSILFSNWERLVGSVSELFSVYGLALVIPTIFLVIAVHEFSHGLTCCHFGGRVHEVGFMLIYFQPAFFCDVSDSWLFPSRRNRMWVTFAGGYAQFIVWGLCALVWRVTDTDTLINHMTLTVLLYSGVQSLINFNPLIKLDGYYMLSDYLEIPNLRSKAVKSVFAWVAGTAPARKESRRVARAQFIYGALAILFSTSLLLYVYTSLYTWATTRYQLAGLIGFAMFSTYTLRKTAAESISGIRALATRASIKKFRNLGIAATLALIAIFGRWELKIPVDFKVIAIEEQGAFAETDGTIYEVLVHENSEVRKGQALARMVDDSKQQKISDINDQIAKERSELKVLLLGGTKEAIDTKEREIKAKEAELKALRRNDAEKAQLRQKRARQVIELQDDQNRLDLATRMRAEGMISKEAYDRAVFAVKIREAEIAETDEALRRIDEKVENDEARLLGELEVLRGELAQLKAPARPEEIQRQKDEIRRLENQRDLKEQELAKTDITSPIDGVVSTSMVEKKKGNRLETGDEFCRIADVRRVAAEMFVPEKEMADVEKDLIVWMKVKAYPYDDIQGKIDFMASVTETVGTDRVIRIKSDLSNDNKLLRPGMAGVAKIYAGERRIIEIMTRRLGIWIRTEFLPHMP